jgi:uncharacterized protein YgiM (DUF1202 family)
MDVYALTPIDEIGQVESVSASTSDSNSASVAGNSGYSVSASQPGGGEIAGSASNYGNYGNYYGGYAPENMFVSGMEPIAGTTMGPVTGTATVIGTKVNVRTGPGTTFPVVTQVNSGNTVTIKDSAFGWNRVVLSDGTTTGWIAGWLLQMTSGTVPSAPKG